jgi:RNA polymerase sigma factor (sigma-70 family)
MSNTWTIETLDERPPGRTPRVGARLRRLASDERLVELVRAGDEPAFEALYDRHHRGILGFCRHMLGSVEEAEDAVQHTFLAAYRSLAADDGRQIHLRPWLYAIARNRCLSVLRARRERPMPEAFEPSTEHLDDAVDRREDLRAMLRDLSALPDDQRAALVLAEMGDVSHDEIAAVLGVRRDKVKALVFQARSSLVASRGARETPCAEIRTQLSELSGGSLRRTSLRRHLRECEGCRDFRAALVDQRKALAVLLPVAPSAALKGSVLGGASGSAAAGAGASAAGGTVTAGASALGGGVATSVGGAGLAAKALVVAAVAAVGTAAGAHELHAGHAAAPVAVRHAAAAPAHHAHHARAAATTHRGAAHAVAVATRAHHRAAAPAAHHRGSAHGRRVAAHGAPAAATGHRAGGVAAGHAKAAPVVHGHVGQGVAVKRAVPTATIPARSAPATAKSTSPVPAASRPASTPQGRATGRTRTTFPGHRMALAHGRAG